jgi:hypothetical protein
MWDAMWYRLHIIIHMKTIQMTIDERLLRLVDKLQSGKEDHSVGIHQGCPRG